MKQNVSKDMILFEHKFWLQILGDHSRFILNSLSPEEVEDINKAKYFIKLFDNLLDKSRQDLPQEELQDLNLVAYNAAQEIRCFKLELIKRHLVGMIKIGLPPTFINHMVNEVDEYLLILCSILQNTYMEANAVHHHLLWLTDGAGHAHAISSDLDPIEKEYIKVSKSFEKNFENLHMKAMEMCGYMRTGLYQFPSLDQLNLEAAKDMNAFKDYLKTLFKLVKEKRVLGSIMPLLLDHMYREECYYLTKLSKVSNVKRPDCDPTKHREE